MATVHSIDEVVAAMKKRQRVGSIRRVPSPRPVVDRSDWVETTTVKPRERPRAGKSLHSNPSLVQTATPSSQHQPDLSAQSGSQSNLTSCAPVVAVPTASLTNSSDTNPFGDDFSRYTIDTGSAFSRYTIDAGSAANPSVQKRTGSHKGSQDLSSRNGFEDSFGDLVIEPAPTPPIQVTYLSVEGK